MLNLTACQIDRSKELPYDPANPVTVVGSVLVQSTTGLVKPSTGSSGELFVGVALSQPMTLVNFPKVEALVVGSDNTITLYSTPISGTLRVAKASDGSAITAGTPSSDATKYSISGNVVTLNSSLVGATINFWYQYVPTTLQARTIQGDVQPGGAASLTTGTIGVILAGLVYTTEYDSTVDWTQSNPAVKSGANGRFTIGGTGCAIPQARVMQAPTPTSTDALLGIYFSA